MHVYAGLLVVGISFEKRISIPVFEIFRVVTLTDDAEVFSKPRWQILQEFPDGVSNRRNLFTPVLGSSSCDPLANSSCVVAGRALWAAWVVAVLSLLMARFSI